MSPGQSETRVDGVSSPRPSRLLLILQSAAIGGMETHAIDLAAEYVRRGVHVKAVVPRSPMFDALQERLEARRVLVERIDTDGRHGRTRQVSRWLQLLRVTRDFRPDVVHLHTPGATGGLAVAVTARLAARHAVMIITEHDVPNSRWGRWDLLMRMALDRVVDAVIAVSRRNAALRARRLPGGPRHFAAVLNGVPLDNPSPSEQAANRRRIRGQLGIPLETVVIGSLVRLDTGKGLDDLLAAFASVASQCSSDLLLVGDGPLRAHLEHRAQALNLSSRVHFAGHTTQPAAFLDAMDAFVLAVPAGSMSIALLEAMGRGLPAVITFCGPEEAVIPEETGLCAPPNDPPGLGQVLLRIAQDSELRTRLGHAGAAHVRRYFSVERVAQDLLDVYGSARHGTLPERLKTDRSPAQRADSEAHEQALTSTLPNGRTILAEPPGRPDRRQSS